MKSFHFVLLLVCASAIACNHSANKETASIQQLAGKVDGIKMDIKGYTQDNIPTEVHDSINDATVADKIYNNGQPAFDWDKKIIKTANVQAECKNYKLYNQQIHALIKQYGGWTAAESEVQQPDRINNTMSIKVGVPQFEELMTAISSLDAKLLEKRISTEDVTGEMLDTKGRIEARKQVREKYMEFLKQAKTMEDVLRVQSEINGIHEELEVASTRLENLQHQSSYSTVNISFYQMLPESVKVETKTAGFGSRIFSAFGHGALWLGELFIGLLSIWPLLVCFSLVFFFIRKKYIKTGKGKQ